GSTGPRGSWRGPPPDGRLGVDVGGTNTDAVVMDAADRVIAKSKVPGTADITSGIVAAIDAVLSTPGVEPQRISHVMLGTTHATNAVLERRHLRRGGGLRDGGAPPPTPKPPRARPPGPPPPGRGRGRGRGRAAA